MYKTERLLLRPWRDDDAAPFAEMNADPEVMRYFLQPPDGGRKPKLPRDIPSASGGKRLWFLGG
ncbi:Uncharacterised protein [Cedecea neteri]|uniref:N-acetyltransferase domain-containing protein n=1 Tax=Cedecea neteri TaxID=158822 RepID=A0A2X3L4Z3_9ENTR|nr:Uncharacterised protein [Cedecea neteri]